MSGGAPQHDTGYGRQAFIVLLLTGGVILLHRFAVPAGVDPTAMLALGFLILASYTIGELVGVIKVPHITGYLAAGLFFGPSAAGYIGQLLPFPPFQEGILNHDVIESLKIFDTLAVALIALTAGGELKIEGLKKGLKVILGVLTGQLALLLLLVGGVIWLVSGPIEMIAVPELRSVGTLGALGLGLVVASISVATSPAATIAVINSTGAKGPMTSTVLSTVVLKDVIVVVAFSVASALAATFIGMSSDDQNLGTFLAVHIGGSLVVGVGVGFALALYLRYVGREILLVIVGVVYAASLLAASVHLDPVLVFMAAGFTASNFSREGDKLIHNVERLSMPVYVIFFTLAGAGLHLEAVATVGPIAAAIVVARLVALYLGVGLGARLSGADDGTRRYGWLGFASQAGVAITLAAKVGSDFGDVGNYLETVIITGVAINELIGPVLLKVGLGLSGEIPSGNGGAARRIAPAKSHVAGDDEDDDETLDEWPVHEGRNVGETWAPPSKTSSDEIDRAALEIRAALRKLTSDLIRGPLERERRAMEVYLRDLRREFLRHHRRLSVRIRSGDASAIAAFHIEEAELAERWRTVVMERSSVLRREIWDPATIVDALDRIVDRAPQKIRAPYEPGAFVNQKDEGAARTLSRAALKARRAVGGSVPERDVEVRTLAGYHLSGVATTQLESIAALLVHGDAHLAARTRSLFERIHRGYESLTDTDEESLRQRMRTLREGIDEELALSVDEANRIAKDAASRLDTILGAAYDAFSADLAVYGTLDLPASSRRTSQVFEKRIEALEALGPRIEGVHLALSATYSRLALELELVGLESRMKEVLDEEVRALEQDVRGRTHLQAERLDAAIEEARSHLEDELPSETATGEETSAMMRQLTDPLEKVATAAGQKAKELRDQLAEETTISPLLDGLRRAAQGLAETYTAPTSGFGLPSATLPAAPPVIEVPFRELVTAHLEAHVAPELLGASRAMAASVEPLASALAEVERLVAFNVEIAGTELDVVSDEKVSAETRELLGQILFGALERAEEIVRGQRELSEEWAADFGGQLRQAVLGSVSELRTQLVEGELSNQRIALLRRRAAGRRLEQRVEALPSIFARAKTLARRSARGVLGTARIDYWRRLLGLPRSARDTSAAAFSQPLPQTEIPLVYRRLFAAKTVESADVLTARDGAIAEARAVLSGKTPGVMRAVALVGPDGVGKGALARAVVRTRAFKHVRHLTLEGPASVEEIEKWFSDHVEGQLFVITGFHYLVAMRAGGLLPLRRFVEGVVADGGRNAWLLHADSLVWRVASQATAIEGAFPDVVEVPALGPRELEAAVLARHGLSGYGLNFEHRAASSPMEELLVRSASQGRRPYEAYFRALHDASGGLVRDALSLWLASIDEVNEGADYVHVGSLPTSYEPSIDALPEHVLLELLSVARQGWMTPDVHAHVYRVDESAAHAQLVRLSNMGLLEAEAGGAYAIPVHLRGAVHRVLRARGWVG